jgi:hypothetical protein
MTAATTALLAVGVWTVILAVAFGCRRWIGPSQPSAPAPDAGVVTGTVVPAPVPGLPEHGTEIPPFGRAVTLGAGGTHFSTREEPQ